MKLKEKGFSYIELVISITIMVLVASTATAATFQVFRGMGRDNDHMAALRQVQNAGHWISRDAQMAQSIITDNLTLPDFLVLNWVERDFDNEPTYHSATYFFENLTDGTGTLKRNHWSSAGANEQVLVAQYIYYNPDDPDDTSQASYQNPVLTVRLAALLEETGEIREYRIKHRPNL